LTQGFVGTPFNGSKTNVSFLENFAGGSINDIGVLGFDLVESEIEPGTRFAPKKKNRSE
jgi:hypothetical protein